VQDFYASQLNHKINNSNADRSIAMQRSHPLITSIDTPLQIDVFDTAFVTEA